MSLIPGQPDYYFLDPALALSQIGDAQTMHGMLTMLEETLGRDIDQIADLLLSADYVGANRLLHPLKGFIPIFCGEALCAHVSQVEALSKVGPADVVSKSYALLRPELDQLLVEVSAYLNEQGAAF
jgi:HPt (histidine-containing phosphotransfer) domain-containing protein